MNQNEFAQQHFSVGLSNKFHYTSWNIFGHKQLELQKIVFNSRKN
jgi:hypothetical protein